MNTLSQPDPNCVIYGLYCTCHPEKGIRYVGQTRQGADARLKEHFKNSRAGGHLPVYRWIRAHGFNVKYKVLETVGNIAGLNPAEARWIRHYDTFRSGHNCNPGACGEAVERPRGPGAKLTDDQVIAVWNRLMAGEPASAIARDIGEVSLPVIYSIKHNRSYKDVPRAQGPFRQPRRDMYLPRAHNWTDERKMTMRERMSGQRNPMFGKRITVSESAREARSKQFRGEGNGAAKVTEDDVRTIRNRRQSGESLKSIQSDYPISYGTICNIVYRRSWRYLE